MKVLGFVTLFVLAVAIALVLAGQMGLLKGHMPAGLGVHNGRLKPPAETPNSVSSQAGLYPDNPQKNYAEIAPFNFAGNGQAAFNKLVGVVQRTHRCMVVDQKADYLYAQCSTALLHFTDDIEFWLDAKDGVIHTRSASRLGQSDLGVNRARVEKIRAQFLQN